MTNEEAEAMLKQLGEFYRQPVMPLRKFCDAVETWMSQIDLNYRRPDEEFGLDDVKKYRHGASYAEHLRRILTDIRKSAFLFRLIYMGEKLRTKRCPTHLGVLSMQEWIGHPDVKPCEHGCGGTGWLPAETP